MMNLLSNPLYISLLLYLIIIVTIIYFKQPMFYLNNDPSTNKLKIFGTVSKKIKTIFPLWFIIIIFAIMIYFIIIVLISKIK